MTLTADDQIVQALADVPRGESLVGVFVSQAGSIATVDQAGRRLLVRSVTQSPVRAGDSVRLSLTNNELVMLGPTSTRSVTGRVLAAGNPASVEYPNGSGVTAVLPVMNGLTLAVNDIVYLDWGSGGLVVGRISIPIVPPTPPADPGAGGSETRTERFDAIDSGSYQGYWRTNDVWSSASNYGAWFYGSKIRDTIPDNARIDSASINLLLDKELGAFPFGRHGFDEKPSGPLEIVATSTLPKRNGEVAIPTSLIDHLKANPGGVGFGIGGYNIWRGTQRDGSSGRLTVTFTT